MAYRAVRRGISFAHVRKAVAGLPCENGLARFEPCPVGRRIVPAAPLDVKLGRRRASAAASLTAQQQPHKRLAGRLRSRAPAASFPLLPGAVQWRPPPVRSILRAHFRPRVPRLRVAPDVGARGRGGYRQRLNDRAAREVAGIFMW